MVNKILERYFLFRIDCKHISYHCVFGTKREISTKQNREEKERRSYMKSFRIANHVFQQ